MRCGRRPDERRRGLRGADRLRNARCGGPSPAIASRLIAATTRSRYGDCAANRSAPQASERAAVASRGRGSCDLAAAAAVASAAPRRCGRARAAPPYRRRCRSHPAPRRSCRGARGRRSRRWSVPGGRRARSRAGRCRGRGFSRENGRFPSATRTGRACPRPTPLPPARFPSPASGWETGLAKSCAA